MPRLSKCSTFVFVFIVFVFTVAHCAYNNAIDVKAGDIKIDQNNLIMSLKNGVVFKFNDSEIMSDAATARLNDANDMSNASEISLRGNVRGSLSNISVSGDHAKYITREGSLELSGRPISITILNADISANRLILKNLIAILEGGVVLKTPEYTITSEKMIVHFMRQNNKTSLKKVESGAKVVVETEKAIYTADKGRFENDVVLLSGNVVIRNEKNCILADEAELNIVTGVHSIKGANNPINATFHK
ncbi:MAG: LptA/OstA family protein [Holosporales bacterium]|nr:LptA/OstA family protein [Holosporales bacterium]